MRSLAALALVLAVLSAGALGTAADPSDPAHPSGPSAPAAPAWGRLEGPAQPGGAVLSPAQAADLPPTIQGGIGPGSALQMGVDGIQSVCTAAFLLRDPTRGDYYLATAGHCLVRDADDPTPVSGDTDPGLAKNRIDVCVEGCINNGLGLGTYVELRASDAYHPVAFAISGGIGDDFGIIRIPAELHDRLRPEMPQWGGPTGVGGRGGLGDLVVHYGHGTLVVPGVLAVVTRTPADQGRLAWFESGDGDSFSAFGHVTGGDSGSAASYGELDPTGLAVGTQALGVITHSIVYVGAPLLSGTTLAHGLDLVREHLGLGLELVPAGDPLPRGPTAAAPAFHVNVTTPEPGAKVDASARKVLVRGTAEGNPGLPAGSAVQLAVDDPAFGTDSRVPLSGNATWSASWDLVGVPAGQHTLRARLVDADGTVLDQENVTITITKGAGPGSGSSTSTAGPKGGAAATGTGGAGAGLSPAGGGADAAASSPKPAPGLAPVALLAVLVLAVALRRRR